MAAFLPYDEETIPFDSTEGNFLQTADDLNHLPPDLISPLPSYALYREPAHYLPAPKPRLNPFDRVRQPSSSQCQQQLFPPPPPSSSTSSLSTYSYTYPSIDQVRCREAVADLDLSSTNSLRTISAAPLISPGLQLYESTSTSSCSSSQFSRYSFPLTPPIDDPTSSNQSSNSYLEWKPCTDLPPPFSTLASGVSTSTLLPNPSTTFPPSNPFHLSTTSNDLPTARPPTPVSQPSSNSPSSSTTHLRQVISSGLARRRARNPCLASPALSCSSIFPLTSSKTRSANGGGRSRLSRDDVSISCSTCSVGIATLQLRGKGNELDVEYRQDFVCFDCRPDLAGSPTDYELPHDLRVGYEATISACLDREQGVETQQRRRVVGSSVRVRKASAPRRDPALELLTCACFHLPWSMRLNWLRDWSSIRRRLSQRYWIWCFATTTTARLAQVYRRGRLCPLRCALSKMLGWWRRRRKIRVSRSFPFLFISRLIFLQVCPVSASGDVKVSSLVTVSARSYRWSLATYLSLAELFDEGRRNCSFSHARMGPIVDLT